MKLTDTQLVLLSAASQRKESLSNVARAITGTAWNGPRFFGLRPALNPAGGLRGLHQEPSPRRMAPHSRSLQ